MNHLLPDHERNGSHDRSAAGRKGKARSPWRKGCPWLSGCGNENARIRTAKKRERIERDKYPGALTRPLFRIEEGRDLALMERT